MARIIVEAVYADGEPRRWTLSERIVGDNLGSDHYVAQLLERLVWATADAEALESPSADHAPANGRVRPSATDAPRHEPKSHAAIVPSEVGSRSEPKRGAVTASV